MTLSPSRSFKNFADSPNGRPSNKCIPSTITFRTVFPICFLLLFGASIYFYMRITSQTSFDISLSPILELSTTNTPYFSRQWLQAQSKQLSEEYDKYHPGISHKELMSMDPFSLSTGINVWDLYPPQLSCPDVMRIGKVGEGGKWVCGVQHLSTISDCVMYSFGISTDMSFEVEILLRTNCIIHAFDPTVGKLPYHNLRPELLRAMTPQQRARIRFHKTAMGTTSGSSQIHSLNEQFYDIMHRLGHSFVHLLKVDIEGGEWAVFNSLFHDPAHRTQAHHVNNRDKSHSKTPSLPVGQLIIELHYSSMEAIEHFFSGTEKFGLLPFSREINLQPCLGGGQPVAAEYSFLHVDNYFSPSHTAAKTAAVYALPQPHTKSWHIPIRAVIYFLTQRARTHRMAGALMLLYENFWRDYPHYPIVIFHDDLRPADERTLEAAVPYMKLRFVAITLELPETLRNSKVHIPERTSCAPGSSTLGYRHMCRFHATVVHTYMKQLGYAQYDYIMRLDDDSSVTAPIGYDIFRFMRENKKEYAFVNMLADEPACVVDLWEKSEIFYNSTVRHNSSSDSANALFPNWPRGVVFYNNFEISAMSLWESATWRQYMQYIDELGGIYTLRWGDAPLHTIGVTMILDRAQIHAFTDIGYRHDPFIDQSPTGLPMPQMDPFAGPNVACHYYDKWMCFYTHGGQNITNNGTHNSSVSLAFNGSYSLDSIFHSQQIRQIHYISTTTSTTPHKSNPITNIQATTASYSDKSVLYTFGHGGREEVLSKTLRSFYENYLRLHSAPVVVFYSDRSNFQVRRLKELLAHTSILPLLELQPVALRNITGQFSPSPCMSLDEELNSASLFLRARASELLRARGFHWLLRFGDDSQLTSTITHNLFERLHKDGKVYGYVTAMEHRAECMQGLWETARRLCSTIQEKAPLIRRLRKSISHRSAESLTVGTPNDLTLSTPEECTDLFPTWPGNKVILTNFEVSHVSVWESPQCLRLFAAIDGQSQGVDPGEPLQHPLWADSVVHTVCVVSSLQASQVTQLTDIPYSFSWENVAKSDADPENRMSMHRAEVIEDYDRAFGAQRLGWLGGDVAASVALPNERDRLAAPTKLLWLFGDSIVGVSSADRRLKEHSSMISNTIGVTTLASPSSSSNETASSFDRGSSSGGSGCATGAPAGVHRPAYFWKTDRDGAPQAIFTLPTGPTCASAENQRVWPIAGVTAVDSKDPSSSTAKLILLAYIVCLSGGRTAESLEYGDYQSVLIIVHNPYDAPSSWRYDYKEFPVVSNKLSWISVASADGSSFASADGEVLLLGSHRRASSTDKLAASGYQMLGRISVSSLLQLDLSGLYIFAMEPMRQAQPPVWTPLYSSVQASQSLLQPHPLFAPAVSEASLHFDSRLRQWLVVSSIFTDARIRVCRSPTELSAAATSALLAMAWNCSYVATIDPRWASDNNLISYAAKAHPHLLSLLQQRQARPTHCEGLDLILSFVSNAQHSADLVFETAYREIYSPKFLHIHALTPS